MYISCGNVSVWHIANQTSYLIIVDLAIQTSMVGMYLLKEYRTMQEKEEGK